MALGALGRTAGGEEPGAALWAAQGQGSNVSFRLNPRPVPKPCPSLLTSMYALKFDPRALLA